MQEAARMQQAAVLGAGTMGHGIAQVCALAGLGASLYDVDAGALKRALKQVESSLGRMVKKNKISADEASAALGRIAVYTDLTSAVAGTDLVIEAVPERLELKREVLREVEQAAGPEALLATNTSSLSIDAIAEVLDKPERFLGLHFFNPVPIMALLEIVVGEKSSDQSVAVARDLAGRLGKEPVVVKDSPGFASSRLGIAIAMEAIRMVEEGVAAPADIDRAMELGYRHPMGPLRLTDLVGLDVRLKIAQYLHEKLGERFRPPALLEQMVSEGRLGKKSGHGFYDWSE